MQKIRQAKNVQVNYYTNRKRGTAARAYKVLREHHQDGLQLLSPEGRKFNTTVELLRVFGFTGQKTRPSFFKVPEHIIIVNH